MLQPAPTTRIDPKLARGRLEAVVQATASKPTHARVVFPNTSYNLHLLPTSPIKAEPGDRIAGRIAARARRVDVLPSGGKYIEPVIGRPRRVQGRVIAHEGGALVVDAGVPIHCTLTDQRQGAADFPVGEMVSFDVLEGATFTQVNPDA